MVTPTPNDLHIDVALTNVSIKYNNASLIGEKVVPVVMVKKDSDKYFEYGKQDFRIYNTKRAPGARAKQWDWTVSASNNYSVEEHALEGQIIDEVRDNADEPIKYESDSIEMITNTLLLDIEKLIADGVANTGNYASGHYAGVGDKWDDFTNSDPLKDVDNAREIVRSKIFTNPNTMVVSQKIHNILRRHPKLLEMYKYTKGGTLTADILKEIFEVENYLVGAGGYLSNAEGQTDVLADVWGKNCAMLYVPTRPGLRMISWSYLFRKDGYRMVERWREDALRSDWVRIMDKYQLKSISKVAGYLIQDVIS